MMTKAYLESVIGRMGEKAEIIIFARDALAYLDRSETAEAERDGMTERINLLRADLDTVTDDLSRSRAFARGLSANIVAAEEARDLAIVSRDEARRERDELGREGDTAHALLNDSIGSRVTPRKGETALVSQARTAAEVIGDLRLQLRAIEDARAAMRRMEIDHAAALAVARMEAAEAEPPQVFRPPISVTVHHVTGHAFAEVEVGDITDPAFLALPMGARLGLVVCDE